jgi:hypothetical protein
LRAAEANQTATSLNWCGMLLPPASQTTHFEHNETQGI